MTQDEASNEAWYRKGLARLHAALLCPVCGAQMSYDSSRGYQCHIEVHNEAARELRLDADAKPRDPFAE